MMESVMDPRIALTAVVPMLLQPKIALSGRWRKRFSVSVLKKASLSQKPDSW